MNVTLQEYATLGDKPSDNALRSILGTKKAEYAKARILLRHVSQKQLIHYGGALMTIMSASELNNAQQLWLEPDIYQLFDDLEKSVIEPANFEWGRLLDPVMKAVQAYYPWHRFDDDGLAEFRATFDALADVDKKDILVGMVAALHADSKTANLTKLGMTGSWRRMNNKAGYSFADEDEFIFQSPSGLFEKRITVAELKRRSK